MILFDEVEKAHPDVWNVLLQVLDDGRLTDGQGRTVDFKNTVVVLTSNVGSTHLAALGDAPTEEAEKRAQQYVMEELREQFRPEFLNRLDEIVLFHRLKKEHLRQIVEIQLRGFEQRLARRDLRATFTTAAMDWLGEVGWDPQFGARPLKRAIQRHVEDPLARKLLAGEFPPGSTIAVDRDPSGELTFAGHALN
ncbi:MAG: hypothetical protein NVSMB47_12600 [Polyangiales bacterium]